MSSSPNLFLTKKGNNVISDYEQDLDFTSYKNMTFRHFMLALSKEQGHLYPQNMEDIPFAKKILLIRSNIDFIIKLQDKRSKVNNETSQMAKESSQYELEQIEGQEDKYDKEHSIFIKKLYKFMETQGQPIIKPPKLGFQDLDLFKLYNEVVKRGGMDMVTRRQEWKEVYMELKIPTMSTSASYNTRTNYKKFVFELTIRRYLYLYELENESQIHGLGENQSPDESKYQNSSEGEYTDSACTFLFDVKAYIKIHSRLHDGQSYYAKILKRRIRDGVPSYYVMYNGWTVSHNEWMPEYALLPLSPEEELNKEKLPNPPAIRSSKSNYLIEEHLGLGSTSTGPTSPLLSSLKQTTKLHFENGFNDQNGATPLQAFPKQSQIMHTNNDNIMTKGDMVAASILASIGSSPNYLDVKLDADIEQHPPTPPPFDELRHISGLASKKIKSNLRNVANLANVLARPITPPRSFYSEVIPITNLASAPIQNTESALLSGEQNSMDYYSSGKNFPPGMNTTNQIDEDALNLANYKIAHGNGYSSLEKVMINHASTKEEMAISTTQTQTEYSRKRRNEPTAVKTENFANLDRFKQESEALHALPPSNGRSNPPPITRNNLSQLATATLLTISQLSKHNTGFETDAEINEPTSPISSYWSLKKNKLYDFLNKEAKLSSSTSITPLAKISPEIQEKLNFLRQRVVEAQEKLAFKKKKISSAALSVGDNNSKLHNNSNNLLQ